jgi:hypothetical protein
MSISKNALVTVVCLMTSSPIYGQEVKQPTFQTSMRHVVGWGIHYAGGDITFGRVGLMLSTLYSQVIDSVVSIEGSVHFLGRTSRLYSLQTVNNLDFTIIASSVTADVSLLFNGNTISIQGLHGGLGCSIRQSSITRTGHQISSFGVPELVIEQQYRWELGANAKLEYVIPMGESTELGLRGQFHLFASPVVGSSPSLSPYLLDYNTFHNSQDVRLIHTGHSASLGVFLRVGW